MDNDFKISGYKYPNSDKYKSGNTELNGESVQNLEVDWIAGNVDTITHDGPTIVVAESGSGALEEKYRLHYYLDNGVLRIKFVKSGLGKINKRVLEKSEKRLLIKLPKDKNLDKLKVNTVSADSNLESFNPKNIIFNSVSGDLISNLTSPMESFVVNTVSGDININGEVEKVEFDSVSGGLKFEGTVEKVSLNTIAGEMKINDSGHLKHLDMNGISGDCIIVLPEGTGFEADLSSVSGSINCDFTITTIKKNLIKSGDGGCLIKVSSVSGDLNIRKK